MNSKVETPFIARKPDDALDARGLPVGCPVLRDHVMSSRWRQQIRAATEVRRFPVTSWMLAGACLCGLAVNEVVFVRPARARLERSEAEEAALLSGNAPRELASGATLMPDGRIVKK